MRAWQHVHKVERGCGRVFRVPAAGLATTSRPHRRICRLPSADQLERYRTNRILHANLQRMSKEAVLAIGWLGAARTQHPMSTFANTFLSMTRAPLDRRGWPAEPGRGIPLSCYCTVSSTGKQIAGKVQSRCVGAGAESSRSRQTPVPCRWTSQRTNEMREPRRLGLHLWFQSGPLPASGSCAAYQANLNFFQNTLTF